MGCAENRNIGELIQHLPGDQILRIAQSLCNDRTGAPLLGRIPIVDKVDKDIGVKELHEQDVSGSYASARLNV